MAPDAVRPDSEETLRLLDRAGRGDLAALNDLLAQHRGALRDFIAVRVDTAVRGRVDPSDIVQDTLVRLTDRLADFLARRPMPFHLWARKTASERLRNACRDHRAARRDVSRELVGPGPSSVALAQSLVGSDPSPSEIVQANELADRVAAAVEELPEADREILLLRQVDALPYEEVGCLLDIEPTAARQRYGRALLKLQRALAGQGIVADR